ncbi:hypothetical protein R50073_46830 [Maricurvus nonylphenolicus]|uniref:hypothetical protein n=1 Tax=Maricurvus nonylphenolicus TaxID=1008307 RepID=UPI0036F1B0B2
MNTLSVEGWHKPDMNSPSIPIGLLNFRVSEQYHLLLERAEDEMEQTHEPERFIDIDMDSMELETPAECGALKDCQLRVYLDQREHRGQFHLIAHRASDDSLVYSNAVMIDQLG